jgi:hypothetical protein
MMSIRFTSKGSDHGAVPGAGPTQESETRARGNNRGSLAGSRLKLKRRLSALRSCEVWDGTRILILRGAGASRHGKLKRDFGWARTRIDGLGGARTWCGHGVFNHNLVKIAALMS